MKEDFLEKVESEPFLKECRIHMSCDSENQHSSVEGALHISVQGKGKRLR